MSRRLTLPSAPGTYVLVLEARERTAVRVGALGALLLEPGHYVYVGSALGAGGLAARLGHHLVPAARPHWHVDHLRRHTTLREIWFATGDERHEHRWAAVLGATRGASLPLARFGASDCRCPAHLFRFGRRPRVETFRRRLPAAPGELVRRRVPAPA